MDAALELAGERAELREAGRYAEADAIRKRLGSVRYGGIGIEDVRPGLAYVYWLKAPWKKAVLLYE